MIFNYKKWEEFCRNLHDIGMISIPACEVNGNQSRFIVLKHDVETNIQRAVELAKIEHQFGHRGSYYIQAYLLNDNRSIDLLNTIKTMGHEVSYHYDVMDSNKGNLDKAIIEFENNKCVFENNGFHIITVCQHGNPVIERIGYTSNRDFFRSQRVQLLYPSIADIMVNYKTKYCTDFTYYSDAGRKFCKIADPINNDVNNSNEKNVKYENLNELFVAIQKDKSVIVSTHPHRWCQTAVEYTLKNAFFRVAKGTAKVLLHVPGMKTLMGKYYYLAKKI